MLYAFSILVLSAADDARGYVTGAVRDRHCDIDVSAMSTLVFPLVGAPTRQTVELFADLSKGALLILPGNLVSLPGAHQQTQDLGSKPWRRDRLCCHQFPRSLEGLVNALDRFSRN